MLVSTLSFIQFDNAKNIRKIFKTRCLYAHLSKNARSSRKICRSSFNITKNRLRNKKSICFNQIMRWYEQIFGHFSYEYTQIISFELLDAFANAMNYKSSLTCVTSLMDRSIRHLINSHWLFTLSIENFAIYILDMRSFLFF